MRPRVFIPGPIGWVLIAAAVAPILIKKAKPVALKIADELTKIGEKLREATLEGTEENNKPPKGSVENKGTTKRGKTAGGARITSSSPTGQEEMQAQHAAETTGASSPTKPPQRTKKRSEAQPKPDPKLNPKRTARTPAKAKPAAKNPKRDASSSQ